MARAGLLAPFVRRVRFHTNPAREYRAESMTVLQREFAHDVASVIIDQQDDDARAFQTGIPLIIDWGVEGGEVSSLNGYVHHTEPVSIQGIGRLPKLKLVCIGASYVMNQPSQRVWRRRTVSAIVREVADRQKFSGHVQDHRQVWESLVQNGSDWEFLVSLAQRVGWTLYVDNTEIHFREPLQNLSDQLESAPFFLSTPQDSPGAYANAVQTFHVVSGETTPDGGVKAQRYLAGFDPRSGQEFSLASIPAFNDQLGVESTTPVFTRYESEAAASLGEAATSLHGTMLANRWHIQAKLEARGSSRVRPGRLISVIGVGERHSGYWYVQSVEHELNGSEYLLHMILGRDSQFNRFSKPRPRARKIVPLRTTPYGTLIGETPPTIYVGDRWRAAYSPRSYGAG